MTNIITSVRQMVGNPLLQTYLCKVLSVDEYSCECEPVNGGANFLEVRLRSVLDGNTGGLILKPKLNSIVIIGLIENNEATAFVVAYSDIDELTFKNEGGITFEVKKDVVKINGDTHDGLAKVKELTKKFNNLENKFNSVLQVLQSVIVPLAPSGTYPFAPLFASISPLVKTTKNEIENTKVKHG